MVHWMPANSPTPLPAWMTSQPSFSSMNDTRRRMSGSSSTNRTRGLRGATAIGGVPSRSIVSTAWASIVATSGSAPAGGACPEAVHTACRGTTAGGRPAGAAARWGNPPRSSMAPPNDGGSRALIRIAGRSAPLHPIVQAYGRWPGLRAVPSCAPGQNAPAFPEHPRTPAANGRPRLDGAKCPVGRPWVGSFSRAFAGTERATRTGISRPVTGGIDMQPEAHESTAPEIDLAEAPGVEAPPPTRKKRRKPRVLVADDDRDMRRLVVALLRAAGLTVVEARNGVELLQRIDSTVWTDRQEPFDVIVSDVSMPGLSG